MLKMLVASDMMEFAFSTLVCVWACEMQILC